MRHKIPLLQITAATAVILLAALAPARAAEEAKAKEEKIKLEEVPAKIMTAVKQRFPDAEVTSATKEEEKGAIIWDIELKAGDKKNEMDIKDDGTVVEVEKEFD